MPGKRFAIRRTSGFVAIALRDGLGQDTQCFRDVYRQHGRKLRGEIHRGHSRGERHLHGLEFKKRLQEDLYERAGRPAAREDVAVFSTERIRFLLDKRQLIPYYGTRATIQDKRFSVQSAGSGPRFGGPGNIGGELKRLQPRGTVSGPEAP